MLASQGKPVDGRSPSASAFRSHCSSCSRSGFWCRCPRARWRPCSASAEPRSAVRSRVARARWPRAARASGPSAFEYGQPCEPQPATRDESGKHERAQRRQEPEPAAAARSIRAPAAARPRCSPRAACCARPTSTPSSRLIGPAPYERALLIEYLHKIQDAEGCLPAGHLQALAELMRLPMAEVYEVATFYAHFDVVGDGEPRPAAVTIRVCDSLSCMLAGAEALIARAAGETRRPTCAWCARRASAAANSRRPPRSATTTSTTPRRPSCAKPPPRATRTPHVPAYQDLAAYRAAGGYKVLDGLPLRRAQGRRRDRRAVRRRPARPRRRRLPDGAQVGPRARREGPAPDGRQRRRGRARHVQGPLLSRDASRTSSSKAC